MDRKWGYTMQNKQKVVQKVCTRCEELKDVSAFKRLLTLSQSSALLKRPTSRRLTVISSRCRTCWSDTKRKTPLTLKDIQNKKASGDLHTIVADLMEKEIRRAIPERRARVMKEYWQKKKQQPIIDSLTQQVAVYKKRYLATKRKKLKDTATEQTINAHHALLRQHSEEYELAKRFRKELMAQIKLNNLPTQTQLNILIKQHNERGNT